MTTTPNEPVQDPDIAPTGDPSENPDNPDQDADAPGNGITTPVEQADSPVPEE